MTTPSVPHRGPCREPHREACRPRRVRAAAAAGGSGALVALTAAPASAATPATWQDPDPMSVLQALLIYGGIPLALVLLITTLVLAPSIVRGDRQQRGVASWTEPQWFGGPGEAVTAGGGHDRRRELDAGAAGSASPVRTGAGSSHQAGGASARW